MDSTQTPLQRGILKYCFQDMTSVQLLFMQITRVVQTCRLDRQVFSTQWVSQKC